MEKAIGAVQTFMDYLDFLKELVKKDFKKKYYKSVLGILWTLLNPLLMMVVITVVFSTLFKRNIPYYPVYYMIGYIFYNFAMGATRISLTSVVGNSNLLRKIFVPKYMFCVSSVLVQFITMLFSLIPLFGVMVVYQVPLTKYCLLFPIALVYIFLFTLGLSLILSAYAVFFRDLNHLYGIVTTLWMYVTPIFYPISIIPQQFLFLWDLNPLYIFISIARDLLMNGSMPSERMLLAATCYSVLTFVTGLVVFHKKENNFIIYI